MSSQPKPPSLTITRAQEGDSEWCAHLMAGTEPWITLRRDLKQCRAALGRPGGELYIAREAGDRAGFILIHPYGCAGSVYIASVAVAERARGRGIGTQLVAFAEGRATGGQSFIFLLAL